MRSKLINETFLLNSEALKIIHPVRVFSYDLKTTFHHHTQQLFHHLRRNTKFCCFTQFFWQVSWKYSLNLTRWHTIFFNLYQNEIIFVVNNLFFIERQEKNSLHKFLFHEPVYRTHVENNCTYFAQIFLWYRMRNM